MNGLLGWAMEFTPARDPLNCATKGQISYLSLPRLIPYCTGRPRGACAITCRRTVEASGAFQVAEGIAKDVIASPQGIESNPRCASDMPGRLPIDFAHCRVEDGGISNLTKYLYSADTFRY